MGTSRPFSLQRSTTWRYSSRFSPLSQSWGSCKINPPRPSPPLPRQIQSPLEKAEKLSDALGNTILLKREDLQSVKSFKLRGAYNKMAHLSPDELARGVITSSAGNHAQGVALSARTLVRQFEYTPSHAPLSPCLAIPSLPFSFWPVIPPYHPGLLIRTFLRAPATCLEAACPISPHPLNFSPARVAPLSSACP